MFDSTNPKHVEVFTKVLEQLQDAIWNAAAGVREQTEDSDTSVTVEILHATKAAVETVKTYAAARLAGDPDFTVQGAWGTQRFPDGQGRAHTFALRTVPGDKLDSARVAAQNGAIALRDMMLKSKQEGI